MSKKIQIVIVEDNAAYARSLQEIIRTSEDMDCIGTYTTAGKCRLAFNTDPPPPADIVLLDLKLPDHGGLSLVPLLRERVPNAGVVVLTQNDDTPRTSTRSSKCQTSRQPSRRPSARV